MVLCSLQVARAPDSSSRSRVTSKCRPQCVSVAQALLHNVLPHNNDKKQLAAGRVLFAALEAVNECCSCWKSIVMCVSRTPGPDQARSGAASAGWLVGHGLRHACGQLELSLLSAFLLYQRPAADWQLNSFHAAVVLLRGAWRDDACMQIAW